MSIIEISCSIKYFIQISYSYASIYTKYNYIYMSIIEISCSIKYFIQISCSIKYFIQISCSIKYFKQISYSYISIYTKYNYIYMSTIEISCSIKILLT